MPGNPLAAYLPPAGALLSAEADDAHPPVRDADDRLYTESFVNPSGPPRKPLLPGAATVLDDPGHSAGFWNLMRASLAPEVGDKIKRLCPRRASPTCRSPRP